MRAVLAFVAVFLPAGFFSAVAGLVSGNGNCSALGASTLYGDGVSVEPKIFFKNDNLQV